MAERPRLLVPTPHKTWLDFVLAGHHLGDSTLYARAELEELRERVKDLEDMLRIAEGCIERL
jgi:hypothetical protein